MNPKQETLKQYRTSPFYRKWRNMVLERDRYTCQSCRVVSGPLEVHHKITFVESVNSRFDPDNGITLCSLCHGKEHGMIKGYPKRSEGENLIPITISLPPKQRAELIVLKERYNHHSFSETIVMLIRDEYRRRKEADIYYNQKIDFMTKEWGWCWLTRAQINVLHPEIFPDKYKHVERIYHEA